MKSADRAPACEFNPGICLTTEEKARKNLSQGSQRILLPITKTPTQLQYHHTHTHNITKSPTHPYITKPTERITTFGDLDLFPSLVRGCVAISGFISTERSVALGPEATTTQPYFDFC